MLQKNYKPDKAGFYLIRTNEDGTEDVIGLSTNLELKQHPADVYYFNEKPCIITPGTWSLTATGVIISNKKNMPNASSINSGKEFAIRINRPVDEMQAMDIAYKLGVIWHEPKRDIDWKNDTFPKWRHFYVNKDGQWSCRLRKNNRNYVSEVNAMSAIAITDTLINPKKKLKKSEVISINIDCRRGIDVYRVLNKLANETELRWGFGGEKPNAWLDADFMPTDSKSMRIIIDSDKSIYIGDVNDDKGFPVVSASEFCHDEFDFKCHISSSEDDTFEKRDKVEKCYSLLADILNPKDPKSVSNLYIAVDCESRARAVVAKLESLGIKKYHDNGYGQGFIEVFYNELSDTSSYFWWSGHEMLAKQAFSASAFFVSANKLLQSRARDIRNKLMDFILGEGNISAIYIKHKNATEEKEALYEAERVFKIGKQTCYNKKSDTSQEGLIYIHRCSHDGDAIYISYDEFINSDIKILKDIYDSVYDTSKPFRFVADKDIAEFLSNQTERFLLKSKDRHQMLISEYPKDGVVVPEWGIKAVQMLVDYFKHTSGFEQL